MNSTRLLRVPWTARRSNQSILKEINPEYSLEGLMLKLQYFGFSISPSNEYSELISFRIDWFDLLAVQETLESSPAPQFESINPLTLSLTYGPTLTSILDYWKSHSFEYMDLCCKVMSLLFNTLSRYFPHSYSMNHVRKMKCICAPLSHDRL